MAIPIAHHPIFSLFRTWQGMLPGQVLVNCLGALTRKEFNFSSPDLHGGPGDRSAFLGAPLPRFTEEYFEWIDLCEVAHASGDDFVMIELGAGFGRWLVNTATARRHLGKAPGRLIAVEAEPGHFGMLHEHLLDNALEPSEHWLIQAAVAERDERVYFVAGHAREWWGQCVLASPQEAFGDWPEAKVDEVEAVSLGTILRQTPMVDFIDLDVQGAEYKVLAAAAELLQQRVKRVHIGTHSRDNEGGLRELFTSLGWVKVHDYPFGQENDTPYGRISFQDGVQSWINPHLVDPATYALPAKGAAVGLAAPAASEPAPNLDASFWRALATRTDQAAVDPVSGITAERAARLADPELLDLWRRARRPLSPSQGFEVLGWRSLLYGGAFRGRRVLVLGDLLGLESAALAQDGARVVCAGLGEANMLAAGRLARLMDLEGLTYTLLDEPGALGTLPGGFDAIWAADFFSLLPPAAAKALRAPLASRLERGGRWLEWAPTRAWLRELGQIQAGQGLSGAEPEQEWLDWCDAARLVERLGPDQFQVLLERPFAEGRFTWFDLLKV